jgi:hypothetical protein
VCSGSWSRTSNHPGQSRVANHRWSPPGMEPPTRLERVTCPLQEGRSASDELRRRAGEAGSGLMGAVAATLARRYPICSARTWAPDATLRRVPGAIRTHTVGVLSAATPTIGLRARGAVTRCRPGSPALRGQGHKPCVTALLPGLGSNQRGQDSESCWEANRPTRHPCARRESNPHPPVFETGRSAGWLYPRVVRRQRIELRSSD